VNFADGWSDKPAMVRRMHESFYRALPTEWAGWRRIVARYYDFVTMLDFQIGRLLHALDQRGLAEDTLVIFTSDHGDMTGAHGGMNDKGFLYEEAHRVPLPFRWTWRVPAGVERDDLGYNMDVLPTVLDLLGDAPDGIDARPLHPTRREADPAGRADLLLENHGIRFLYSQRALVTDDGWKYIFTPGDRDECYDLSHDPGERFNLIDRPEHHEQVERLRDRLIDAAVRAGDPLATGIARFCGRWRNLTGQPDATDVQTNGNSTKPTDGERA